MNQLQGDPRSGYALCKGGGMSRLVKLIEAFKECNGPFPYKDLCRILSGLGYRQTTGSGSKRGFVDEKGHVIRIHEPHPGKDVLPYVVRQVRETLQSRGLI